MRRTIFEEEHELFRKAFLSFVDREVKPNHERFEAAGRVDRELFGAAARSGFVGLNVPERFGGGGSEDFKVQLDLSPSQDTKWSFLGKLECHQS
jgi:alkylation response protein AidB-like acyl-CoA dehydrogenase